MDRTTQHITTSDSNYYESQEINGQIPFGDDRQSHTVCLELKRQESTTV